MKTEFMIFPVHNDEEILIGESLYYLTGYYRNLLFAYQLLDGNYFECDFVLN